MDGSALLQIGGGAPHSPSRFIKTRPNDPHFTEAGAGPMRPSSQAPRDTLAQTSRGSPVSLPLPEESHYPPGRIPGPLPAVRPCPIPYPSSALHPTVRAAQKGQAPSQAQGPRTPAAGSSWLLRAPPRHSPSPPPHKGRAPDHHVAIAVLCLYSRSLAQASGPHLWLQDGWALRTAPRGAHFHPGT